MGFKNHYEKFVRLGTDGKPRQVESRSFKENRSKSKEYFHSRYEMRRPSRNIERLKIHDYDIRPLVGYDVNDYKNLGYVSKAADVIQDFITHYRPARVLELGSGTGMVLSYMAKRNPKVSFYGSDFSRVMCMEASRKCGDLGLENADIIESNEKMQPFLDGSFDLVYQIRALEFSDRLMREKHRLMRSGGVSIDAKFIDGRGMKPKEWSAWKTKEPGKYERKLFEYVKPDFSTGGKGVVMIVCRKKL